MKKWFLFLILSITSLILVGCNLFSQDNPNVVEPNDITVEGYLESIEVNKEYQLTAIVLPSTSSQEVTWASSDSTVVQVNQGLVKGLKVGSATVTVTSKAKPSIKKTLTFNVIEQNTDTNITEVIITGDNSVNEGETLQLTAQVKPVTASQEVTWESSDESIATVNENGIVTAIKPGDVNIKALSKVKPAIYKTFSINVKQVIVEPTIPDLKGYDIKIMVTSYTTYTHDPFDQFYPGLDKEEKQNALTNISELFNCDFQYLPYPDDAGWGSARMNYIIQKATTNTTEADIYTVSTEWIPRLVEGNAIVDTLSFYNLYGKNKMNSGLYESAMYKGGLYSLPNIIPSNIAFNVEEGIIYNYGLVESLNLESPAKLFNEGRWTYTGFSNYVKLADTKLGSNQTVLSGKPMMYYIGMTNAAGVKLADSSNLKINFDNPNAIQSATILRDLVTTSEWGSNAYDIGAKSFNEGNSIFCSGSIGFLKTDGRYPINLWGQNTKYGFVPYPYPDNMSKENTKAFKPSSLVYTIPKGITYPEGVTAQDIYYVYAKLMQKTEELIIENPNKSIDKLTEQLAQTRVDDPESVKAIVYFKNNSTMFDSIKYLQGYSYELPSLMDDIIINGFSYDRLTNLETNYEDQLKTLYFN